MTSAMVPYASRKDKDKDHASINKIFRNLPFDQHYVSRYGWIIGGLDERNYLNLDIT